MNKWYPYQIKLIIKCWIYYINTRWFQYNQSSPCTRSWLKGSTRFHVSKGAERQTVTAANSGSPEPSTHLGRSVVRQSSHSPGVNSCPHAASWLALACYQKRIAINIFKHFLDSKHLHDNGSQAHNMSGAVLGLNNFGRYCVGKFTKWFAMLVKWPLWTGGLTRRASAHMFRPRVGSLKWVRPTRCAGVIVPPQPATTDNDLNIQAVASPGLPVKPIERTRLSEAGGCSFRCLLYCETHPLEWLRSYRGYFSPVSQSKTKKAFAPLRLASNSWANLRGRRG